MTATRRRPGLSLTEVLAALFIMAIGAISILVLFPLGALNMASALKDDRTSQAALQSDSFLRFYWASDVVAPPAGQKDPFVDAFTNPGGGAAPLNAATNGAEPSYPVFLDPMGVVTTWSPGSGGTQTQVAGRPYLPRQNMKPIHPVAGQRAFLIPPQALRTCSLLDGMTFDPSQGGQPLDASGNNEREYRYNWLWVLQLPRVADPNTATMTVVVFDKRTYQFVPNLAEHAFTGVTVTPNATSISVPITAGVVLGKGGWIMEAGDPTGTPAVRATRFYRIVSATENGTNIDLELDRRLTSQVYPNGATFVVLAGVSEVFERPNLTP